MDYRQQSFKERFDEAAKHLSTDSATIESMKVRDMVNGRGEYADLLHALENETDIRSTQLHGNFGSRAHLVQNSKTAIILVEHETGLELLYIGGSIASIIGLIPLVLRCWSVIRNHGDRRHPAEISQIEIRRFDKDGRLIENRSNAHSLPWASPLSVLNTALLSAAENVDEEIKRLRIVEQDLISRVSLLEQKVFKTKMKSSRAKKPKAPAGGD